jgi:hypothetical protein
VNIFDLFTLVELKQKKKSKTVSVLENACRSWKWNGLISRKQFGQKQK